jgi:hypothetical protein
MISDMLSKFKNKQGLFKGKRDTFSALEGYADMPEKRGYTHVASTVDEQFQWMKEHVRDHFNVVLSIEKTNATSVTADLIVEGKNWGTFTTLELLRLKSILDSKLKAVIHEIPVRDETIIWKGTTDENYDDRAVFEGPLNKGFTKTTLKSSYILPDPHPDLKRQPQVAEKSEQVNTGEYSSQLFSGEWTMKQRADLLVKYDKLYTSIVEALEEANNVESQESDLGNKVLDYLF